MSRAQLTSTVEQNTGGAVSPYVAGKNFIANGNFDWWQRGTSFASPTGNTYLADRIVTLGGGGTNTIAQETSVIQDGSQYSLKITAGASSSFYNLASVLESGMVSSLAGKTVTFSIYVRANATYSGNVGITIDTGTVANSLTGTWTTQASASTSPTTSGWTRLTCTYAVPSGTTALRVTFLQTSYQVSGAIQYWSQAQLEIGSVATPFSRAGGTLSGELTACQRYYYQLSASFASDPYTYFSGNGYAATTTIARAFIPLPVSMRTTPSLATNTLGMRQISNDTLYTSGTFSLAASYPWVGIVAYTHGSAVFTTGNACILTANNSTAAYVALSAEL